MGCSRSTAAVLNALVGRGRLSYPQSHCDQHHPDKKSLWKAQDRAFSSPTKSAELGLPAENILCWKRKIWKLHWHFAMPPQHHTISQPHLLFSPFSYGLQGLSRPFILMDGDTQPIPFIHPGSLPPCPPQRPHQTFPHCLPPASCTVPYADHEYWSQDNL